MGFVSGAEMHQLVKFGLLVLKSMCTVTQKIHRVTGTEYIYLNFQELVPEAAYRNTLVRHLLHSLSIPLCH